MKEEIVVVNLSPEVVCECGKRVKLTEFNFFGEFIYFHNSIPQETPFLREHGVLFKGQCECGQLVGSRFAIFELSRLRSVISEICEQVGKSLKEKLKELRKEN